MRLRTKIVLAIVALCVLASPSSWIGLPFSQQSVASVIVNTLSLDQLLR